MVSDIDTITLLKHAVIPEDLRLPEALDLNVYTGNEYRVILRSEGGGSAASDSLFSDSNELNLVGILVDIEVEPPESDSGGTGPRFLSQISLRLTRNLKLESVAADSDDDL